MELREVAATIASFLYEPQTIWNRRALIFHRASSHLQYRRHQLQRTTAHPGDQLDFEELAAMLSSMHSLFPMPAPRCNMQSALDMYASTDMPWSIILTAYFKVLVFRSRLTITGSITQEIRPYLDTLYNIFAPYHVILTWLGLTMDFTAHPIEVYDHLLQVSHVQAAIYTQDMDAPDQDEQGELRDALYVVIRNLDIIWRTRRTWFAYARHNAVLAQAEYNRSLQLLRSSDVMSLRFLSTCRAFSQARQDHLRQYRMSVGL